MSKCIKCGAEIDIRDFNDKPSKICARCLIEALEELWNDPEYIEWEKAHPDTEDEV